MQLIFSSYPILLINTYFPYFNTRELAAHTAAYRDTLGFVENVMSDNPNCKFMLLADFNCNLNNASHPYTQLLHECMAKFNNCGQMVLEHHFVVPITFDHPSRHHRSVVFLKWCMCVWGVVHKYVDVNNDKFVWSTCLER